MADMSAFVTITAGGHAECPRSDVPDRGYVITILRGWGGSGSHRRFDPTRRMTEAEATALIVGGSIRESGPA